MPVVRVISVLLLLVVIVVEVLLEVTVVVVEFVITWTLLPVSSTIARYILSKTSYQGSKGSAAFFILENISFPRIIRQPSLDQIDVFFRVLFSFLLIPLYGGSNGLSVGLKCTDYGR